ncbi:MAG: helix-turn-helix transcriptional regulator [Alphaproteobacteria bacterium]|nr:helix-turn-helix transcriptional regulator [Alphaproteobacteria bacterium]
MQSDYDNTEKVKKVRKSLDAFIGDKVKYRRTFMGMSQEKLGSFLGITFQQVQKYEKGVNRISASMLYTIASVLNTDFQWFVDGFGHSDDPSFALNDSSSIIYNAKTHSKKEMSELIKAYYTISDPVVRKKVIELVKSFSNSMKKKNEN